MSDRLIAPLAALSEFALAKGIVSAALAALANQLNHKPEYVVLVCLLVLVDFITGVIAARKQGKPLTSGGLRQTAVKFAEYALLLVAVTAFGNVFDFAGWLSDTAYLYVCSTELISIGENLKGSPVMDALYERVKESLLDKLKTKEGA